MRKLNLPQKSTNKVAIRLFSPPTSPPNAASSPEISVPAAVSPQVIVEQPSAPVFVPRKTVLHDDTLEQLMNPRRVKSQPIAENDLEDAPESPIVQERQQYEREQAFLPDNGGVEEIMEEEMMEDDPSTGVPYMNPQYNAFQQQQRPQEYVNEQETELQKIVEKARLLARITQLSKRGVKPDKLYTINTSVYELKGAVAKLEVIDQRSRRIEQGRAALMLLVGTVEKGSNWVDNKKVLPLELAMNGYTDYLFDELPQFDDCLERGVEELLGPAENRKWYHDLMLILGASMFNYSIKNRGRKKQDLQETVDAVKNDPSFREALKREIMAEMRGDLPAAPSPLDKPATITHDDDEIIMEGPKLTRQLNSHPHGDISPRPGDTTNMLRENRRI